jgi:hypothetical protein
MLKTSVYGAVCQQSFGLEAGQELLFWLAWYI